jgi:hypothetical protein
MAQPVFAEGRDRPDFRGLESLFEFTNIDGALVRTNCGQAAAATFLTQYGKLQGSEQSAGDIMTMLERDYPPDQFFGFLGTGRGQVERICRVYRQPVREIEGENDLKVCLRRQQPVIVMLGVSAGRLLGHIDLPGGHWMVAFGYDDDNVYLSNWGTMPWGEFRRGWHSPVPRLISMFGRGLIAESPGDS